MCDSKLRIIFDRLFDRPATYAAYQDDEKNYWKDLVQTVYLIKNGKDFVTSTIPADLTVCSFQDAWHRSCEVATILLWPKDLICTPIDAYAAADFKHLLSGHIYIVEKDFESHWWLTFERMSGGESHIVFHSEGA